MRNLTARDLAPCHARPQRAGREEHQERDQVEQLAAVTKEAVGVRARARAREGLLGLGLELGLGLASGLADLSRK